MNTETGKIYRGEQEIAEAKSHGEQIAEVSERVAALVERGAIELDKDERRKAWRERWFNQPQVPHVEG